MLRRSGFLLIASLVAASLFLLLALVIQGGPAAAQSDDGPQAESETMVGEVQVRPGQGDPTHTLFAGNDTPTLPQVLIDVNTGDFITAFVGIDAWGAAYDPIHDKVYHTDGSILYEWPLGSTLTPTMLGTISDTSGSAVSMHGLAFYSNTLYGSSITTDEVYTINLASLIATTYIDLTDTTNSISGLAIDPNTGDIYGTADSGDEALVRINLDGTVTAVAPYLGGETDVDGLAISPSGLAYLITDDPTPPYYNVFDLNVMTYTGVVSYPWGANTAAQVSGAWIEPNKVFMPYVASPPSSAASPDASDGSPVAFQWAPWLSIGLLVLLPAGEEIRGRSKRMVSASGYMIYWANNLIGKGTL